MKLLAYILPLLIGLIACNPVSKNDHDHIVKSTEFFFKKPDGEHARISFTGYLVDTDGPTRIVVTSMGDTIRSMVTDEPVYTLSLIPRDEQTIHFINNDRKKVMILVNFINQSERETYDVQFNRSGNVVLCKYRSSDNEWKVINWRVKR